MGEMQDPLSPTPQEGLASIAARTSLWTWVTLGLWGGGRFLGPLSRKMAGTKHSGVLKVCDPVSFERPTTVLYHREHQAVFHNWQ